LQTINDLFASEQSVFVFPAGLVSRKRQGKIMDLEWKKTFITRSVKFNKPIVPVYNDGRLSNFFYRLANVRKFFGIKANLEMFYLADELFKQSGKTINIRIGEPVDPSVFDSSKSPREWAEWMKNKTYALQNQ
jgi:putative hemolysin